MREKAVIILFDCANMFTCTWIKLPVCCGLIFSFFIIIISQKSVHKTKKNNTEKKKQIEKIIVCSFGKDSQMLAKL